MSSYDFLASCYDELTTDVGYPAWADYLEAHFRRKGLPGRTVLDLACGTGSLTWELAARGYEMIGVDRSPEMLAEAAAKGREDVETPPFSCVSPWTGWICTGPSTPVSAVWTASTMSPTPGS